LESNQASKSLPEGVAVGTDVAVAAGASVGVGTPGADVAVGTGTAVGVGAALGAAVEVGVGSLLQAINAIKMKIVARGSQTQRLREAIRFS